MKSLKSPVILFLMICLLGMASCADEKKKNEVETVETQDMQHDPAHTEKDQTTIEEAEVVFENPGMQTIFQQYLEVKNALVASNPTAAAEAAEKLGEILKNISAKEAAVETSAIIAGSTDLNVQRDAFSKLSGEIETLIVGSITSGAIYQQYCPMAFEGEGGYWLSSSMEIRNPYYGDKMLKCGSVEKTFE